MKRLLRILDKGFFALIIVLIVLLISVILLRGISRTYFYPFKFREEIIDICDKYDLDRFLVLSIIRTESGFDKQAESEKGAKGLMQICDRTAEFIAEKLEIEEYDLFNPETNVEFGCFYLKYLISKFDSEKTAICAYNAGEGIVRIWLDNNEYSQDGINLTEVPYSETKKYVKKIYETKEKYEKLYGNILDK